MTPQTKAAIIGKYGCLAMCYIYCLGLEGNEAMYLELVSNAMDKGLLDNECTVLDAAKFLEYFSGKKYQVEKKEISNISKIVDCTPVRFDYDGHSHWVVVENGKIVFNSLAHSVCVEKGKPTTARYISLITRNI